MKESDYLGLWEHLKTGNTYRVIGLVENATNVNEGMKMALYHPKEHLKKVYVREIDEFEEKFIPDYTEDHKRNLERGCRS